MSEESQYTDAELRKMLSNGIVKLEFTKADGSNREMYATTVSSMMPEEKKPKAPKTQAGDLVQVFDLELKDWRALKASKVHKAEYVPLPVWHMAEQKQKEKK